MSEEWQYQIRIGMEGPQSDMARNDPANPAMAPLAEILSRHNAAMKCQYDAFAGYVAEAEREGIDKYPLYEWTKATIENPAKKDKYLKAFTLYVDGDEVYARDKAEALEQDLTPLVGGDLVARMTKHDTNPANNPQPPKRYRK